MVLNTAFMTLTVMNDSFFYTEKMLPILSFHLQANTLPELKLPSCSLVETLEKGIINTHKLLPLLITLTSCSSRGVPGAVDKCRKDQEEVNNKTNVFYLF